MEADEIIGNDAAADLLGVKPATLRSWVQRGYGAIPQPHRREVRGGHALPVYSRSALLAWWAARPGKGWRAGKES